MNEDKIPNLFTDGSDLIRAQKAQRQYYEALAGATKQAQEFGGDAAAAQYQGIRSGIETLAGLPTTPPAERSAMYDYLDKSSEAKALIDRQIKAREAELAELSPLGRMSKGFAKAANEGTVDHNKAFWEARTMRGQDSEAPRISQMFGSNPTITRANELLGIARPEDVEARELSGLGLEKDGWARAGQLGGTFVNDIIQDRGRNIYWLLNAAQAVANVGQEAALGHFVPELYQADEVKRNGKSVALDPDNEEDLKWFMDNDLISLKRDKEPVLKSGVNRISRGGKTYLSKRLYKPGAVDRLAIPTGLAVNAGVGLLNPFGGGNGYSAVFQSEDDPTKTSNVVGEVAAKYFLG